jgi:hypothetical protein
MNAINNSHCTRYQPAQFLVENIDLLPRDRALDVAMGIGGLPTLGGISCIVVQTGNSNAILGRYIFITYTLKFYR